MNNIKNILNKEHLMIIISFIIIILLLLFIPNLDNSFIKSDKLYINEILVNNTYTHKDNYGNYTDYIEIYNGYKHDINLSGYNLSDKEFNTNKWTFPNITIKSKEYLLIYASGLDECDLEKNICHTNFKLSSNGETITLSDKSNIIINKFTYPKTTNDISYGYNSKKYSFLSYPTPGTTNSKTIKYQNLTNKDIYINEYMIHNQRNNYTSTGEYSDFIELYNNSSKDITLNNIYLTDNIDDLTKYKLPNITIKKDNYLLVYLSDKSIVNDNEIIANFKLSDTDKIVISNGRKIIDELDIINLPDNVSYGKNKDKWYYYTSPTPGSINNTKAHTSLGGTK